MIKFKLCADGAFVCGDTESGVTVYAYPTSIHARAAKRDAMAEARACLKHVQGEYRGDAGLVAAYDARNWEKLNSEE